MAVPMSDEELYQLTGSWEAAAALRDEQARAANQNTQTASANVVAPSANFTLDDLKALYKQKGATEARENVTEQGTNVDYIPIQYGQGWSAFENDNRKIIDYIGSGMDATPVYDDAAKTLGGFSRQEGDYVYNYDPEGKYLGRTKWNESNLKTLIRDLGPLAMAAVTMGGGGAFLGNSLFGLTGNAASAAGGALAGGINAYGNDQDILKGALLGGVSGAGTAKLSDILGADALGGTFKNATVGDVSKAINFAKDPTLAGAANLASPYVTTNFELGDTGFTTNDLLKGVNTVQALGSGDNQKIFNTITGLVKGTDFSGLTANEQAERDANRETARLNRIEDAVLNQPASDDGSTQGIVDLISEMYPAADIKGMSQGDLAKFLEANINEIQGSADLETLLKGAGQTTADEGTLIVTGDRPTGLGDFMLPTDNVSNVADKGEMVITGNRNGTSLNDFISLNTPAGDITDNYADDTLFITGNKDGDYVPSLRTKEIKSDIPDELTVDDIDTLFPDLDINDILQTVTIPGETKTVVPTTKTTTPTVNTPTVKKTTEDLMDSLGLNRQAPSQDPYANIKLMEELFGGDVAYKLRSLGAPKNLASADMDALVKLLRG
jgi:hypothetical protein